MRIRQARPEDAPMIAEVYVRSWRLGFAGIIPQHYLDAMDPRAQTPGWRTSLD